MSRGDLLSLLGVLEFGRWVLQGAPPVRASAPFLRVRGRTRVRSREQPANHLMTYPPASRGREWNFTIPLLRVRGRTRVRSREQPATPHLSYPPVRRSYSTRELRRVYVTRQLMSRQRLSIPPTALHLARTARLRQGWKLCHCAPTARKS